MFYSFDIQETDCGRFILYMRNRGDGAENVKIVYSLEYAGLLIQEELKKCDQRWKVLHPEKDVKVPF